WSIICSKRWAKPVLPRFSFLEPTWYQRFTWTSGSFLSWWRITWRPFGRVYFSKGMDTGRGFGAAAVAVAIAASAMGTSAAWAKRGRGMEGRMHARRKNEKPGRRREADGFRPTVRPG